MLVIGLFIVNSLVGIPVVGEHLTNALFLQISGFAVFLIAAGLVLPVLGGAAGAVAGKRCARCGKRVEKNQLYCRDHQKAALEELRDRQKSIEDTSYGRRKR